MDLQKVPVAYYPNATGTFLLAKIHGKLCFPHGDGNTGRTQTFTLNLLLRNDTHNDCNISLRDEVL